jgi:hypothetical protein
LPPSPRGFLNLQDLAPASGRQDHTTSPSASATLVSRGLRVHRISPRVRDDARSAPCHRVRRGEPVMLICPSREAEYFSPHDWTPQITLQSLANLVFWRSALHGGSRTLSARSMSPLPSGEAGSPRRCASIVRCDPGEGLCSIDGPWSLTRFAEFIIGRRVAPTRWPTGEVGVFRLALIRPGHDPEKWIPVFRKDHAWSRR